jgi:hypothetical protein
MNAPTIKACSVKVMRSYDYCHFEISLSSECESGEIPLNHVDALRKEAARLVDKAVLQYSIAKDHFGRLANQDDDSLTRLRKLAEIARQTPEWSRSSEEKALIKSLEDRSFALRQYDYQDDWEEEES